MILPAITLWQPYAQLPFVGAKPWETRTRPYPKAYEGQRIVVHAAKAFAPKGVVGERLDGLCRRRLGSDYVQRLTRGAALGTVLMGDCLPVEDVAPWLTEDEIAAGDFSEGRWAWRWTDAQEFPEPIPCRGWQGWGKFEVPVWVDLI